MDEENKALNAEVGEEANLDTTPVAEQQAVAEVDQEVEASTEGETGATGEEPKKGYQSRIRELNAARKAAEEEVVSLRGRIEELTAPSGYDQQDVDMNKPIVEAGDEVDAQTFERDILKKANAQADLKIKQAEAINRINADTVQTLTAYPQLDEDSDDFNPELSEAITEATDAYVRKNPYSANVKAFVDKMMKPYIGALGEGAGQATENVAKQVSKAALRPNSIKQEEKSASEKSIEELENDLGIVIS